MKLSIVTVSFNSVATIETTLSSVAGKKTMMPNVRAEAKAITNQRW